MQTTLPPNMRGWDTGTLDIKDVKLDIKPNSGLDPQASRLRIVTNESSVELSKKDASVSGNTVNWENDQFRMPIYNRYASNCVFEIGKGDGMLSTLGVKKTPEAIAVLWLQDLTDDVEQEVKLPVLIGKDMATLRQNAINDFTKKHHGFEVVGFLTVRMKMDSGLDEDHAVSLSIAVQFEAEFRSTSI